jgi:hypothetical protein
LRLRLHADSSDQESDAQAECARDERLAYPGTMASRVGAMWYSHRSLPMPYSKSSSRNLRRLSAPAPVTSGDAGRKEAENPHGIHSEVQGVQEPLRVGLYFLFHGQADDEEHEPSDSEGFFHCRP